MYLVTLSKKYLRVITMVKIYLDAGHGGSDQGASGYGLKEKDLTLTISNKIYNMLQDYKGVTVKRSRSTDKTLSLSQRTNEANKWGADLFLSIHINAGGGSGFESYVYNGSLRSETENVRSVIHDEIIKSINVKDRGKKKANFHVLRESKMNALLTENMFIDTKKDSDQLKSNLFLDLVAHGHVNGIVKYYKLKKKKTTSKPSGKLYKVQTGAFSKKENADQLAKKLKKDGYDVYIVHE